MVSYFSVLCLFNLIFILSISKILLPRILVSQVMLDQLMFLSTQAKNIWTFKTLGKV